MARAVRKAIAERHHLAIEAPFGIGKTYAYPGALGHSAFHLTAIASERDPAR